MEGLKQPLLFIGREKALELLKYILVSNLNKLAGDTESALVHASSLKNPERLENLVRSSILPPLPPTSLDDIRNSTTEFAEIAHGYLEDAEKEKLRLAEELKCAVNMVDLILEERIEELIQELKKWAVTLCERAERLENIINLLPEAIDRKPVYIRHGVPQYRAEAAILDNFAELLQLDSPLR